MDRQQPLTSGQGVREFETTDHSRNLALIAIPTERPGSRLVRAGARRSAVGVAQLEADHVVRVDADLLAGALNGEPSKPGAA